MPQGRLVILSGPSGVGKSPLAKALHRFHPDLAGGLQHLVLHNCRAPRPGETDGVDYHFGTREKLESLRENERFIVIDVRGDLQALDLDELDAVLADGDVFFEGNPFVGRILQTHEDLADVDRVSAFLAPLCRAEIEELREQGADLAALVTDVMRRKLLRRTQKQKGILSLPDLENIEQRCQSAPVELREAHEFQWVIPNHDGEDSENWDAFYYPLGDARKALVAFAALLAGETPTHAETWPPDLWP